MSSCYETLDRGSFLPGAEETSKSLLRLRASAEGTSRIPRALPPSPLQLTSTCQYQHCLRWKVTRLIHRIGSYTEFSYTEFPGKNAIQEQPTTDNC